MRRPTGWLGAQELTSNISFAELVILPKLASMKIGLAFSRLSFKGQLIEHKVPRTPTHPLRLALDNSSASARICSHRFHERNCSNIFLRPSPKQKNHHTPKNNNYQIPRWAISSSSHYAKSFSFS